MTDMTLVRNNAQWNEIVRLRKELSDKSAECSNMRIRLGEMDATQDANRAQKEMLQAAELKIEELRKKVDVHANQIKNDDPYVLKRTSVIVVAIRNVFIEIERRGGNAHYINIICRELLADICSGKFQVLP